MSGFFLLPVFLFVYRLLQDSVAIVRKAACRCLPALLSSCCQDLLKVVPARPLPRFVHDLCCEFRRTRSMVKQEDGSSSSLIPASASHSSSSSLNGGSTQDTSGGTEIHQKGEKEAKSAMYTDENKKGEKSQSEVKRESAAESAADDDDARTFTLSCHISSVSERRDRDVSEVRTKDWEVLQQGVKQDAAKPESSTAEKEKSSTRGHEEKAGLRAEGSWRGNPAGLGACKSEVGVDQEFGKIEGKKDIEHHQQIGECVKEKDKEESSRQRYVSEEERKRTRRLLTTGEEVAVICDILEVFAG